MTVRNRRTLSVVLPLGLLATAAFAQDGAPSRVLPPNEALAQARDYQTKIGDTVGHVQRLSDEARKKKDAIKLNCVNDKLVNIKGHQVVANQSLVGMQEAISRGNEAERQHELTRMTIVYQKVLVLGTEAENCVGEEPSYIGQTSVDVEVDPSVPDDDPTQPQLPLPDVTRPPEASPFT